MGGVDLRRDEQASVPTEVLNTDVHFSNPPVDESAQCVDRMDQTHVLVDLLKQVSPLSESPDVLSFFVRLGEIHALGLVEDRSFITRILPLVSRGLLQFLAGCLRDKVTVPSRVFARKNSWVTYKARVLDEYFPHFVRERLIRNLTVFNFHLRGKPVRTFIDQVFQVADFLLYEATELQLVERIVTNLHPDILKQAAFLDKPRSRRNLFAWSV